MANTDSIQIIPYYSHPHVHSVINDNSQYDETTQVVTGSNDTMPYATVMVIGADKGIDNRFVRVNQLSTKQALFGKGNFQKYGQPSIQADILLNGRTDLWLCRVLPDNAQYANMIVLAHYRKGKILDELSQETGKVRLEIKFSTVNVTKDTVDGGALTDDVIDEYARSFASTTADPITGYITVPLFYARSIGRGQYGNDYSLSINRDSDAEKEYNTKMYKFSLIDNSGVTRIANQFSGSLVQGTSDNYSTLIDDVLGQYSTGSCPISITPYEEYVEQIYNFYHQIVNANRKYLSQAGATADDIEELKIAQTLALKEFDPIFGYQLNTRTSEIIPYYQNYTIKSTGAWIQPQLEVPNTVGATKPLNLRDWSSAYIGALVLVAADPLNGGLRWLYTVTNIDSTTGNILYDEGVEVAYDEDQYDGVNLANSIGQVFDGGHDGDFQEITVNGITRSPSSAEMKLLLSKEYVKAFRGEKDRRILSPARINLDFIFDANYNMTTDETLITDDSNIPLYNGSTVLTDKDAAALSVLASSESIASQYSDLNVKQAMYDLNEFRNRNGMTINLERGAGCTLYLDCGLVGLKETVVSTELLNIINAMEGFTGRQTVIDLGYYDIFDPLSGKRISVTATYKIAKDLVPHIMVNGINKPFVNGYAQLTAIQNDVSMTGAGDMIRDSFMPDIDLIDWDVKEKLYTSRINYWVTSEEGRIVQRACQNTRETDASALLEENNVRVLNTLKKNLEKACRGYLYAWNEPEVRKGFTEAQTLVYKPWIGTIVQDLTISFEANEWEQERMIMHCYVSVKFRDIIKRIIVEINISRPTYSSAA